MRERFYILGGGSVCDGFSGLFDPITAWPAWLLALAGLLELGTAVSDCSLPLGEVGAHGLCRGGLCGGGGGLCSGGGGGGLCFLGGSRSLCLFLSLISTCGDGESKTLNYFKKLT